MALVLRQPDRSRAEGSSRIPVIRAGIRNWVLKAALALGGASALVAAVVPVGSGSYTTTYPGVDSAGRNALPPAVTPNLSGAALGKPVPTNDWWSNFLTAPFGGNCFNYPLNVRAVASGLVVNYTVPTAGPRDYRQPMSDVQAIVVGTNNLSASKASVSNYSDWTVTLSWDDKFSATLGQGMPITYYTKASSEVAKVAVNFNAAFVSVSGNKLIIQNNYGGSNYVVYAPAGSTWSGSGGIYTSTLNGKNYWSMAMLPPGSNVSTMTTEYEKHAYVFPGDTKTAWTYNAATGVVRTTFTTTPVVKEGSSNTMLQGLLPHHWAHLAADSPQPSAFVYKTVRGQMKMLQGNTFYVENKFSGILPTLPNLAKYSAGFSDVPGFDLGALTSKLEGMQNNGLDLWTDSYNEGQAMNRLLQAARIADQLGLTSARNALVKTIKDRLENWFTASSGEVAFLFYYDTKWTTLIGYPAGHHTDDNLNDHHYHWGYFINAAAMVEQYNPGWAAQWGGMVNLLVRDVASTDRNDTLFPYLRNFNPYDGHAWGNGTCNQPFGVDEESTPESMNFNSGLIQWALATGNTQLRDLGIYLYTTELTAVEEYWFDMNQRTFQPEYLYPMVARLWAGGYDNGTWWSDSLSACYGIQLYPIHGGTMYMGNNTSYVQRAWNGIVRDTGVMSNQSASVDPNCWYDVFWCYQSFMDPDAALSGYNRWQGRDIKPGISDAQTYHWLHTMRALGKVRSDITADYATAAVFDKNSVKTYVAHNFGASAITVHFSDGFNLNVPARSMATNRDISAAVTIAANASKVSANAAVTLTATATGSGITKVEFYQGPTLLGSKTAAPYTYTTGALTAGLPRFWAKVYVGSNCNVSNVVKVQVGDQVPYSGTPVSLPGTIQAGEYDAFEGGSGQDISYSDVTPWNEGGFRPSEAVDAGVDPTEGHSVGWIDSGEWLTYTVNVTQGGTYKVTINAASGLTAGGGPFWFEVNGTKVSPNITVPFTDTNWSSYLPTVVNNVTLPAGRQVLKLVVGTGGFNLGRMKFEYVGGPTAPSITTQPASKSVTAGQTATFSVAATGTAPLSYQWRKNGTAISGATAATYTTPATTAADNGATFSVVVSNSAGNATSTNATLTVSASTYTITASAGANGTITPSGSVSVSGGADQTFIITPAAGYSVSTVTVDGVSTDPVNSYTFFNVTAAHSISATFAVTPVNPNLALGRTATASSTETSEFPASLAVDGNATSRWSSVFADPQWIAVDLGSAKTFNRVVLRWEGAYAKAYQIQTSNDNATWSTVYTQNASAGGNQDFTFASTTARYIRMYGTVRGTEWGYSLYEFEVYNTVVNPYTITASAGANGSISPSGNVSVASGANQTFTITPAAGYIIGAVTVDGVNAGAVSTYTFSNVTATHTISASFVQGPVNPNLALGKTATASTVENATYPASLVVDGNAATRWSSVFADPQWVAIDLGSAQTFNRVVLRWEGAFGKTYQIQASNDNSTWSTVYTQNASAGGNEDFTFNSTTARYIRMYGTARGTEWGYSLFEFEVYNTPITTYTISASAGANGSITPSGSVTVASGANQSFTITPASGYAINTVTIDGASAPVQSTHTFSNVKAAHSISVTFKAVTVAPAITTQPVSKSVTAGATATFSVTASGTAPLSYQWRKNGTAISGATSASYTTPAAVSADNGAAFSVVVSNSVGSVTSSNAILTVASTTPVLIDDFNSASRWNSKLNSLGKAITTSGGLYNLEGEANLYFFYNGGGTAESFTTRIDQSLAGRTNLVLVLKGQNGGEQSTLRVVLNDGTDRSVSLATYGTLTTSYKTISIPLSAFGANLASVAYLRLEGRGTATTIRIDNISVQ